MAAAIFFRLPCTDDETYLFRPLYCIEYCKARVFLSQFKIRVLYIYKRDGLTAFQWLIDWGNQADLGKVMILSYTELFIRFPD